MELVDLIVEIEVGQGWMRGREGRKEGRRKTEWGEREGGLTDGACEAKESVRRTGGC
jgi:hypothetical protein